MTTFDAHRAEMRELLERLAGEEDFSDVELDRMLERLEFLREQIDLARKEVEGARLQAVRQLQVIQEQVDRERLP